MRTNGRGRILIRRVAFSLAFALLVLGGGFSQEPPGEASRVPPLPRIVPETFPPALRETVKRAYEEAVAYPWDPSASGHLGMVLQAYNHSDTTAEICYRRARVYDPSSFRWAYYLSLVQSEEGHYSEAVLTLQEALRLDPDYLPAQLKLGDCFLASGRVEEAANLFTEIVRRHPHSAQAYYRLGRVLEKENNLGGAGDSFGKACELYPNFGAAHYALMRVYERQGKTEASREELRLYEKNKYDVPDGGDGLQAELNAIYTDPGILMGLGIEYGNQGKLQEAVVKHEEALRFDPGLVGAHINLISLYGRLHNYQKAEKHYREAAQLDPNRAETYYDYGVLLLEQDKFQDAESAFRKSLELDPHNAQAHNNLGDILQRQGKLTDASGEFRKAIENLPDFPQAHFNLGRILVNQGNYTEGIPELLKTLGTSDEDAKPSYLYAVGAAYARSGDAENGLRYLRMARVQAAAEHQSNLAESIDRDLKLVETSKNRE